MSDPFRHHPELRDKVTPFATSFWRDVTIDALRGMMHAMPDGTPFPFYPDATREALRAAALDGHAGDLWVFAYGSLIWDPALDFAEVRRAHAPGHARRFILVDAYGGRGTRAAPGLMAALDTGDGCHGVAFRIAADKVEAETRILFRREMIAPGYHARFIPLHLAGAAAPVRGLAFLADHDDEAMIADIPFETQVRYAATGAGFLGTSLDYLENTLAHLGDVGIADPASQALLEAARAYRAAGTDTSGAPGAAATDEGRA